MNRIRNLFQKDLILGIKDVFIILEIGFAVFIVLLLLFIIPADLKKEAAVFIYDPTKIIENFVKSVLPDHEERKGEYYVESREEIIEGMLENKSAMGMIITKQGIDHFKVEFLTQPYTSEWIARDVEIEMEDLFSMLTPPAGMYPLDVYEAVRITSLQWGIRDILPFNKRIMPPILLQIVGILGLFTMVSLIGQERTDLTIRAFRISPGSLWEFLVSKHLVILLTGLFSFSVLYLPMIGFKGYLESLLIIVLTIIMGSGIGVILGSFFKNPIGAMLWVLLLMMVLALPVISLFSPIFSPDWLKFIPSYHTIFGLDAAIFPDNNSHIIRQGAAILAGINVILLPLSAMIFNRKIRKEA